MKHLIIYLFVFYQLCTIEGFAQRKKNLQDSSQYLEQPNRIEFEIGENDFGFTVINGGVDGLLVLKQTAGRGEVNQNWVMYKLDTLLEIEWVRLLVVPASSFFKGYDYSAGRYFALFSGEAFKPAELIVYTIDAADGYTMRKDITTVFPLALTHFEVIGNSIMLAGTTNWRPAVVTFDLDEGKPRVIPGIYGDNIEIVDIIIDDVNELFTVVSMERMVNKRFTMNVRTYTTDNLQVLGTFVNPGDRKTLIDGAATSFSGGSQYLAGAYSNRNLQYSRGLYLARMVSGRQQFIKYYNYDELTNFFGYLKPGRQQRMQSRIEKRKESGRNSKFNYRLLVHEMIERGNEIILVAEAYYPRYSNYNSMMTYGGMPMGNFNPNRPMYYSNIIGYRYTHAIVVAFDRNGNILWDHSFPLDNLYTVSLKKFITVNVMNDRIDLLYLDNNMIKSKIVEGNQVLEGKSYTPIRLSSDRDEFKDKDTPIEGLERWYADVLFAYGQQEIEQKITQRIRSSRKVFYINKITSSLPDLQN